MSKRVGMEVAVHAAAFGLALALAAPLARASGTRVVDLAGGVPAIPSTLHRQSTSADGRFVAFISDRHSIVEGVPGGPYRVYVRDMQLDTTELVSRYSDGAVPLVGSAYLASISPDGRYVVFKCSEPLTPNAPIGWVESVYVYDRTTDTLELVSVSSAGIGSEGSVSQTTQGPIVSADGRYVIFESIAPLTADAGTSTSVSRVYRRDRIAQQTVLVSHMQPTQGSSEPPIVAGGISADGSRVLYQILGNAAINPIPSLGIYVRDFTNGSHVRVDVDPSSTPLGGILGTTLDWSYDGERIAVAALGSNPTIGDFDMFSDIYIIDWKVPAVTVASLTQSGANPESKCGHVTISDDGRYIAFELTGSDLVPWNQSFKRNVILRDLVTLRNGIANVSTIGVQSTDQDVLDPVISGNGGSVLFVSSSSMLVPGTVGKHYYQRDRLGFTRLGYGKSGSGHTAPQLNGGGSTEPGGSGSLSLAMGTPFSQSLLYVAIDRSYLAPASGPFKGTVLVTAAPLITIPLPVDAFGQFFVNYTLPINLPLPPEVYLQCAMPDPLAINGVAVSSALLMGM